MRRDPAHPLYTAGPKTRAVYTSAVKLALQGKQVSRLLVVDDRKPYCDDPVPLHRHGDPRNACLDAFEVVQWVPCRKCARCMRFRQMQWRERAMAEIAQAPRSWMVTLTFSPVHLAGLMVRATASSRGTLTQRVDDACYEEVQKYFKRLRKAGARFRYMAVFEGMYETQGHPVEDRTLKRAHYHILLHEKDAPISWRVLTDAWRKGSFSHAKLVGSPGAASYATKYLLKSAGLRMRASARYGQPQDDRESGAACSRGEVTAPRPTPLENE